MLNDCKIKCSYTNDKIKRSKHQSRMLKDMKETLEEEYLKYIDMNKSQNHNIQKTDFQLQKQ